MTWMTEIFHGHITQENLSHIADPIQMILIQIQTPYLDLNLDVFQNINI